MFLAHALRMRGVQWCSGAALLAMPFIASSCGSGPTAPAMPNEVEALAAQYDGAAAGLDANAARAVFMQTQALQTVLGSFTGLRFVRDVIDDATSITPDAAGALDIQGTIDARAPCPGWSEDDTEQGFIDVAIGVDATRIQRAFSGHATRCRFVTQQAGMNLHVVATMDLQVDLGGDIGFGETAPAILIRATNASGSVDGAALDLRQRVFSFRLAHDGSIETLVELTPLDPTLHGSVLLALRSDGNWSLRTRHGEWVCGDSAGSASCMLEASAS